MSNDTVAPRADQIAQIIAQGPQAVAPPAAPAPEAPVAGAASPPEPPVTGAPPAEPESFNREYVEQLRREAADARAQAFAGLQGTNRTAVEVFARAVAEGDDEAIDNWLMQVAQHRGLAFGEAEPEPQTTPYGAPPTVPPAAAPLTMEDVQRIADERAQAARAEWEAQQRADQARARIDADFKALGVDPASDVAQSLRNLGARLSHERGVFVPPVEVLEAWKAQAAPLLGVTPAPTVPGAVPPVAPVGVAAHVNDRLNMTPEARALARLLDNQRQNL